MRGAPNEIHGAPVTVQVTLPTRRLFSLIIRVVAMRPLISSADAGAVGRKSSVAARPARAHFLVLRMMVPFLLSLTELAQKKAMPERQGSTWVSISQEIAAAKKTGLCHVLTPLPPR